MLLDVKITVKYTSDYIGIYSCKAKYSTYRIEPKELKSYLENNSVLNDKEINHVIVKLAEHKNSDSITIKIRSANTGKLYKIKISKFEEDEPYYGE